MCINASSSHLAKEGPMGFYICMKTYLFIDGENFKKKIVDVLRANGRQDIDWTCFNFKALFDTVLEKIHIDEYFFYAAKITKHPLTKDKSAQLIARQRSLKLQLERQGFKFVISGRVRGYEEQDPHTKRSIIVFREKGVDVRIAVDLVSMACDGDVKKTVIASSDSDLQPAINELRNRKIETIYLGFETKPNKGMTYTTSRTILIRDTEILRFYSVPLL
jgi:uncharacterized LabA/DUF88 family protein